MSTFKDISNQKFGTLRVNKYLGHSKWECSCEKCGNKVIMNTSWLNKLDELHRDGCKHVKPIQIGDKFGFLTVVKPAEDYIKPKSGKHERQWLCECKCGRTKIILEDNLKAFKSTSCGKCSNRISIPEKSIYYYLSKYFNDIQENYRPAFLKGKELDIFLPSLNVGIEYDGERWHKNLQNDISKEALCKINGIALFHIREPRCPKLDEKYVIYTPKPTTNATHMTKPIQDLISLLNSDFKTKIDIDVNCLRDNADICKTIISTHGFNSLEYEYPEIAKEWDYEKNSPLKPSEIASHSGKKAYWICPKGHSYASVIASRTGSDKCGCPICSNKGIFLYQDGKYIGGNSLFDKNPIIASEFDELKNGYSSKDIAVASNKNVWWKCSKCGYEWKTKVNNRTSSLHTGCPECAKREKKSAKKRIENAIMKNGSLLDNKPDLCNEWDYTKNTITPDKVCVSSHEKVWWICPNGHSFQAEVSDRTKKRSLNCPICKNPNLYRKIKQYTKDEEFIRTWLTLHEAAKFYGIKPYKITKCCLGESKTAGGFIWKFCE